MKWYVYAQNAGGLEKHGTDGFVPEDHPRIKLYHQTSKNPVLNAYILVGESDRNWAKPFEVVANRRWSTAARPIITMMKRLLTVRTEWSKK